MIAERDMAACRETIRHGSLSFHAASRLLPSRVRDPALALYAFCRLADDAVDLNEHKADAVLRLRDRLDRVYAGRPENAAPDRAFAAVVEDFDMPRAVPESLLEGLGWDATGRRYATLSDLRAYSARVAATVGVMMCVLMRVRDPHALARAADLGVAMQLTNISRDVGEDARAGRLYLPTDWLTAQGIDPDHFLANPDANAGTRRIVKRLLAEATRLYHRAEAGIGVLPLDCRAGIFAARHIYDGIGGRLASTGFDSISTRARTTRAQKSAWLCLSAGRTLLSSVSPRSPVLFARPLDETRFLVEAAARRSHVWSRSDQLFATLSDLAENDRARQAALIAGTARPN
ncbi:15-cis-phytoene synthase [Roseivivax sp. THAF30]|uniref:15-cis-phytoene synthase n=1 Tax=Roseivivax sp. THAF30 TaxID=2587852 RepID=UPI0012678CD4|nr:phytoene/squalene synthase family protein [Roseivivax sp. THAF30]